MRETWAGISCFAFGPLIETDFHEPVMDDKEGETCFVTSEHLFKNLSVLSNGTFIMAMRK